MYYASEGNNNVKLHYQNEKTAESSVSFVVSSPTINTSLISQEKYEAMLRYYIDKYRISGKTYNINYTDNE